MIDADTPIRISGVLEAEVDGDRVLMSPKRFEYFGLVETGSLVWDLIDGQRSVRMILDVLETQFDDDPEAIRADVLDFLSGLEAAGLIGLGGD